jgi:hypothetical protein
MKIERETSIFHAIAGRIKLKKDLAKAIEKLHI